MLLNIEGGRALISTLLNSHCGEGGSGAYGHFFSSVSEHPVAKSLPAAHARPIGEVKGSMGGRVNHVEKIIQLLATISGMLTHYLERRKPGPAKTLHENRPVTPLPATRQTLPHLSDRETGSKPADIWGGFYQGQEGNCVTVSAIKAAMTRFGQSPLGIYERITATADGYDVVMRDDYRLHITKKELEQAAQVSSFKGSDSEAIKDANFLYAVSAKRAHEENNEGTAGQSFAAALNTLNDGEAPGEALRRLGLYAFMRGCLATELAQGAIGTLAYDGHSMAVIGGHQELYGINAGPPRANLKGYEAFKLI